MIDLSFTKSLLRLSLFPSRRMIPVIPSITARCGIYTFCLDNLIELARLSLIMSVPTSLLVRPKSSTIQGTTDDQHTFQFHDINAMNHPPDEAVVPTALYLWPPILLTSTTAEELDQKISDAIVGASHYKGAASYELETLLAPAYMTTGSRWSTAEQMSMPRMGSGIRFCCLRRYRALPCPDPPALITPMGV